MARLLYVLLWLWVYLESKVSYVFCWINTSSGPTPPHRAMKKSTITSTVVHSLSTSDVCTDRRSWLTSTTSSLLLLGPSAMAIMTPTSAHAAASTVPTPAELERIRKGHARVRYLLDHWDDVTSICGTSIRSDSERKQVVRTEGGGGTDGCEKNPLEVQQYMGYKSTEDPLYRVEKLLVRAVPLVENDPEGYLEVVEAYKERADNTAMMAYTSSWGEANPNGGKEVIDEYLERTRQDVVDSERYLRQILGYLGLQPLPPSKNP